MKKSDVKIAREVILAQVASDGGKNIDEIKRIFVDSYPAYKDGYKIKEKHILRAISLINKSEDSDFRYFVTKDGKCPLVYFDYKAVDLRCQVSFHCPYSKAVESWATKASRKNHYGTRWDEDSSRESCMWLAQAMWQAEH